MPESPPGPRRAATCTPAFPPAPVPQPYFWLDRAWGSWLRLSLPAAPATKKNDPDHGKTNPHHRPALHLGPRGRNAVGPASHRAAYVVCCGAAYHAARGLRDDKVARIVYLIRTPMKINLSHTPPSEVETECLVVVVLDRA